MDRTGEVKILIKRGAHVMNCSNVLLEKIKKDLSFKNPKYENAKRYGLFIGADTPAFLRYYSYNKAQNVIYIPRGYIFYLIRHLKENNIPFSWEDHTTLRKQIFPKFKGKLRDYQQTAVNSVIRYPGGILESGTGSGKTTMGIYMITVRKQPTLIVVHSKELLYQWKERINQFLGEECGLIGDGNYSIKPITVAIINSLRNRIKDIKDEFGHVILDEVHRSPASTWVEVMDCISAKYLLGLSATAYRNDGLGNVMNAFIGPKIHVVDTNHLQASKAVLKPVIHRIETQFYAFYENYQRLIKDLTVNERRNKKIVKEISDYHRNEGNQFLVVSDRVNHCIEIADMLEEEGLNIAVLTADVPSEERKEIIEELADGNIDGMISTIQLIAEGFDAPNLHALFLTTPIKYKGRLTQVVGRILRPEKGKTAELFDFRDDKISMLQRMGRERDKTYRKEKWS